MRLKRTTTRFAVASLAICVTAGVTAGTSSAEEVPAAANTSISHTQSIAPSLLPSIPAPAGPADNISAGRPGFSPDRIIAGDKPFIPAENNGLVQDRRQEQLIAQTLDGAADGAAIGGGNGAVSGGALGAATGAAIGVAPGALTGAAIGGFGGGVAGTFAGGLSGMGMGCLAGLPALVVGCIPGAVIGGAIGAPVGGIWGMGAGTVIGAPAGAVTGAGVGAAVGAPVGAALGSTTGAISGAVTGAATAASEANSQWAHQNLRDLESWAYEDAAAN